MADIKANILMTISAVVVTLSVRYLTDPHLKWAVIVLIAFCLLTILLATYANAKATVVSQTSAASERSRPGV